MSGGSGKNMSKYEKKITSFVENPWFSLVLIIIPLFLALFFRMYPLTLPATQDWAEDAIRNNYINQVESQIRQNFPYLPADQIRGRSNDLYREWRLENSVQVEEQKKAIAAQFRQQRQITLTKSDGTKYEQTYFLAIDPYFYLRRAENVANHGNVCDEIRDGVCWDTHKAAPFGGSTRGEFHSYVEGAFITVFRWFGYPSMTGAFFLPAIFAALATIPIFFIVQRRYGNFSGLIAAAVAAIHPVFLGRTPAGFVDTDVWNLFFPALILLVYFFALDSEGRKRYIWMGVAGLLTGIYSQFWAGWFFAFVILLLVLIGIIVFTLARYFFFKHYKKKKDKTHISFLKQAVLLTAIFVVSSGITVSIVGSPAVFIDAFMSPLHLSSGLQDPINANLWPNVHTTVAELNTIPLSSIISQIGGKFLFIAAVLGAFVVFLPTKRIKPWHWGVIVGVIIYYLLLTHTKALSLSPILYIILFGIPMAAILIYQIVAAKENIGVHYGLFAVGWFGASIFATSQGTRFLILLVPIFSIVLGFAVGWFLKALPTLLKKEITFPEFWTKVTIMVVVLLLLFSPWVGTKFINKAHQIGKGEIPSMNDAWWSALTTIKEDSQPNAIITSWWDFGHWFKYVADRPVNFDGASQNTPNAHWVGKLLQTADEREALGILRMIDCGSNRAFENIQERKQNTLQSYRITRELIGSSTVDARAVLEQEGFPEDEINTILGYSHCTPPEAYVIVSGDMVGKSGVWSHFGLWDFEKSFVYSVAKSSPKGEAVQLIEQQLGVPPGRAEELHNTVTSFANRRDINTWISPWPGFLGQRSCPTRTNDTIICNIQANVGQQGGVNIIADTLYVNLTNITNSTITLAANGQLVGSIVPTEITIDDVTYDLGGDFLLGIRISGNSVVIGDRQLVNGMFSRLFYQRDPGQYFTRVTTDPLVSQGNIFIYKADWEKYLADVEA